METIQKSRSRKAFTLIELLVVIAIIAILAAILFPVFARARENARRASCQSNMKQIALGVFQYTQDYDSALFPYKYWSTGVSEMAALQPYLRSTQIFRCPSDTQTFDGSDVSCTANPTHWLCSSYGFPAVAAADAQKAALINIAWGGSVTIMDSIPSPSQTCLMAEVKNAGGTTWGNTRFFAPNLADGAWDGIMVPDRHFDGSNYAFMDGHVKWLKRETALVPYNQNKAIRFYWYNSETS